MKIYLVGGAVRDKLLSLPVKDRDWVVTGVTPEHMLAQGYTPVGQDFPVFLHPETKEEYALARTERKSGKGYTGFVIYAAPGVTLEEDLQRRDLTINAMAEAEDGSLVDPYHGRQDLENKVLRHVSPAFREDPLRILRVARFAARFSALGFTIADETLSMMKAMVASGEAGHLVPERVWQETLRALGEQVPGEYFATLERCHALEVTMPEWRPFITSATCTKALQLAAANQASNLVRCACLFANTPGTSKEDVHQLAQRLRFPTRFAELAKLTFTCESQVIATLADLDPGKVLTLFEQTDAFRRQERFKDLLQACTYIASARSQLWTPKAGEKVLSSLESAKGINAKTIVQQGFKGPEVGQQLRLARLAAMNSLL